MKADIHIHTNFSCDGISSPAQVVRAAIEKNIQCIAITDHGQVKGAVEAMTFGFDKNILVIPGIEITTLSGDILGINVKKIIPNHLSAQATVKAIKEQGGIAVIPHPFDGVIGFWGRERGILDSGIDALEVFNATTPFRNGNKRAFEFSQENNLAITAGSDAHRADFVGRGFMEFSDAVSKEEDILAEIKNKNVKIQGASLNFLEILRNGSRGDIFDLFRYRWRKFQARKTRTFEI